MFIIFVLNGLILGILFDIFRILRKSFKTPDFITYIEDIAFWLITGLILLYSIFKFNNGELRSYIFLGVILGTILYMLVFSTIFVKISVKIILTIKKIINLIIIKPIAFIYKILKKVVLKPITFVFINFRKMFKNMKKLHFFGKNKKIKKDLI